MGTSFENIIFINIKIWEIKTFEIVGKGGGQNNGGFETIGVNDRLTRNGKPAWWNLDTIFEILKHYG